MQQELPFEDGQTPEPAPKPRTPRRPRKPKPPQRGDMRLTAWIAVAIIMFDQLLKYWVVHVLRLDQLRNLDVLPPWLNLRMAWNQGVNFGLLSSEQDLTRWLLIAIAVAICLWVWVWLWRSAASRFARVAGGLLIGGAIGNVIDRLAYGAVADFLNMSLPGWQNPYSFNVADIAIFAGAIGLVLMPQDKTGDDKSARKPRRQAQGKDNPRDGGKKSG
ncbi:MULTISPECIES: signal peptidase II [unclassified Paracoccus (in: a-proteobacteria)]|uniref:signal peptidase II n=1 Tax=unclassified Paracoccus (in: a-proteobacteria) TaxID=2688777 RepID=UPI001FFDF3DB|nr:MULTISPECIES: signal peptidase II [unclassified Paracoccus (in: a-proteobacteria)]